MQLDPFQLITRTRWAGPGQYMLKRYGEAVRLCREWASRMPDFSFPSLARSRLCAVGTT